MLRFRTLLLAFASLAVACSASDSDDATTSQDISALPELQGTTIHFLKRHRRPLEPAVDHRRTLAVELPSGLRPRVESMVLRTPRGATVLDCDARRGHWGTDMIRLADRLCMSRDVTEDEAGDGGYQLDIKLAGRDPFRRVVRVAGAWPSTNVKIDSPVNVPFNTPIVATSARPTLQWQDFTSTEFNAATDTRSVEVYVTVERLAGAFDLRMDLAAGTTQVEPPIAFREGEHRASVTFREARRAGPIVVSRDAETLVRFFSGPSTTRMGAFAVVKMSVDEIDFVDRNGNIVLAHVPAGGDGPHAVAFGNDAFVITNSRDHTLSVFDPRAQLARSGIRLGQMPESVSFGGGSFVVTNGVSGDVSIVDAQGLARGPNLRLGGGSIASWFGDGVFAVAAFSGGKVDFIDPNGTLLVRDVPVGREPRGVAFGDGVFAVTNSGSNSVTFLKKDGTVVAANVAVGRSPRGVAFGDGVFVTANADDNTVSVITPAGRVVPDVRVGRIPKGVAFGEGAFVIANSDEETVTLIDKSGALIKTVDLGGTSTMPIAVTFGELQR
jgi:YVTN family beta-propeller protein